MPQFGNIPKTPVLHLLGAGNMPQYLFSQALSQGKASFLVTTSSAESTLRNVENLKKTFPNARITAEVSSFDARQPAEGGAGPVTSVISVKPQVFKEMSRFPSNFTQNNAFVVSMMAGVQNEQIQEKLALSQQPVRIMPNLPAKVGCGVVGLLKSDDFAQDARQTEFEALLSQSSLIIDLPEEQGFHWVTAVAGSGPAFSWEVVKRIEHIVAEACPGDDGQAPDAQAVKNTAIALLTDIAQELLAQEPLSSEHANKLSTFAPSIGADAPMLDVSAIRDTVKQEVSAFVNGVKSAALTENPTPSENTPQAGGHSPAPLQGALLMGMLNDSAQQQAMAATANGSAPQFNVQNGSFSAAQTLSLANLHTLTSNESSAFSDGLSSAGSASNDTNNHPPLVSDTNLTAAIYGTLLGSARLYAESSDALPDLQTAVRSKKGTTDAGLNVLTARQASEPHLANTQPITEEIARDTIIAAMDRSKALAGNK